MLAGFTLFNGLGTMLAGLCMPVYEWRRHRPDVQDFCLQAHMLSSGGNGSGRLRQIAGCRAPDRKPIRAYPFSLTNLPLCL